jgi:hypothetical protein
MGSSYGDKLIAVRKLNEENKGGIYKHSSRGTFYSITGFSVFKSSKWDILDEEITVHYVDIQGNPHTRLYDDFFGEVLIDGKVVKRFIKEEHTW